MREFYRSFPEGFPLEFSVIDARKNLAIKQAEWEPRHSIEYSFWTSFKSRYACKPEVWLVFRVSSRCKLNRRYDYDVSRHVSDDGRLKTLLPIKISGYQTKQ